MPQEGRDPVRGRPGLPRHRRGRVANAVGREAVSEAPAARAIRPKTRETIRRLHGRFVRESTKTGASGSPRSGRRRSIAAFTSGSAFTRPTFRWKIAMTFRSKSTSRHRRSTISEIRDAVRNWRRQSGAEPRTRGSGCRSAASRNAAHSSGCIQTVRSAPRGIVTDRLGIGFAATRPFRAPGLPPEVQDRDEDAELAPDRPRLRPLVPRDAVALEVDRS